MTFLGASGATYTVNGSRVTIRYSFGSVVGLAFHSPRKAMAYASTHGRRVR